MPRDVDGANSLISGCGFMLSIYFGVGYFESFCESYRNRPEMLNYLPSSNVLNKDSFGCILTYA